MTQAALILLATAGAGLLAGASAPVFLCAAAAAAAATWLCRPSAPPDGHDIYATLDPLNPDGSLLAEALRETLALVGNTRKPARLRLSAFTACGRPVFRLDVNRTGDLELSCDNRRSALKRPGIWLPDHPLPLALPHTRSLTLLFEPCDTGRIRVLLEHAVARCACPWPVTLLAGVAACALDAAGLLAATLGFAFQSYLLQYRAERTSGDP